MKRKFCIVLSAIISLTAGIFGLSACDDDNNGHVHEYGEWIVVTAATCTESGERRYK